LPLEVKVYGIKKENVMENLNIPVKINFRFNHLDKFQAYTLVREILGSSYEEKLSNNCYVGSVPLSNDNLHDINDFYVRQRVDMEQCDIFVSVSSDSGTTEATMPAVVNRMLKYIDCKITFSFTVV
jgi:hypothetical protein